MKVLVVHGPNTRLGRAAGKSVVELDRELESKARSLGLELRFAQSNAEGALIDRLEQERGWADAVLLEPGPLAHAGWSLREALVLFGKPAMEIVSQGPEGEPARGESIFKDVCEAQLEGADGWFRGLEQLARRGVTKTIGSKGGARVEAEAASAKTIGRGAGDASSVRETGGVTPGEEDSARPAKAEAQPARTPAAHGHAGGHSGKTIGRREQDEGPARSSKTIGRRDQDEGRSRSGENASPEHAAPAGAGKSIGRRDHDEVPARPGKTLGRGEPHADPEAAGVLGRALLQQKIRERLSGRLGAPELASWAKDRWLELQRGAVNPPERDRIEDVLQKLALSNVPPSRLSDEQLLDLLTGLDR